MSKVGAMLGVLEGRLQALGQCELEHYNVSDWYSRFGFMYMSFMRETYAQMPQ